MTEDKVRTFLRHTAVSHDVIMIIIIINYYYYNSHYYYYYNHRWCWGLKNYLLSHSVSFLFLLLSPFDSFFTYPCFSQLPKPLERQQHTEVYNCHSNTLALRPKILTSFTYISVSEAKQSSKMFLR